LLINNVGISFFFVNQNVGNSYSLFDLFTLLGRAVLMLLNINGIGYSLVKPFPLAPLRAIPLFFNMVGITYIPLSINVLGITFLSI